MGGLLYPMMKGWMQWVWRELCLAFMQQTKCGVGKPKRVQISKTRFRP